jgi:NADPH2:quinone reductase
MKAIEVKNFGAPEVMQLVKKSAPEAGIGEVVVQVRAIGVNPVETYIRAGTYPKLPDVPYTPGGNVAGIISARGPDVSQWQLGDRVYSSATISGAYAEMALCRTDQVFRLPDNISFAQGAAIGVPAATAWRGLFIRGGAKAGERVLVHGASGSVGQAALQLARDAGMIVYGTAGTEQGCSLVRDLGAVAVNHNEESYDEALLRATSGEGFHLILEMLANKNLEKDLLLLAPRGRVIVIGSRGRIEIDPRLTMGKETEIRGLAVFNASHEEAVATHTALISAMERGVLLPSISCEMALQDAPLAHDLVMNDGNCGKIVLIP